MNSIFRIVNTLRNDDKVKKGAYTLQFVDYVETEGSDEPLEVVRNSVDLMVGQILRDALNMAEGLDAAAFAITDDSPADKVRYVEFIKEINAGIPKEGLLYCYRLYDDFYTLGRSRDAYVPTMNVKLELDCSDDGYLEEYYYIDNFEDMLVYDFYMAVKGKMAVKKCQLCGTYFITRNRTDELYCSAECRSVISRQRSKIHHRLDDESELLKRRIASRLQQRTKVANEALREEREQVHQQFLYDVKQWKKKIKKGTATAENYKLWLQSQDIKYATMLERKEPLPAEVRPTRVIKSSQVAPVETGEGRDAMDERELAKRLAALARPEEAENKGPKAPNFPVIEKEPPEYTGASWQDSEEQSAETEFAAVAEEPETAPAPEPVFEPAPEPEYEPTPAPAYDESLPLEQQGVRPDIKARIMNFGGMKSQNVRSALFSGMDSYEELEKQIEENDAGDLDFGSFIKNTYGKSIAENAAKVDENAPARAEAEEGNAKAEGSSSKIVGSMRPTNIRKSSFPTFESVLAAVEREESMAESGEKAEAEEPESRADEGFETFTVEDMKARMELQKEALKANGLEELAGLLDDAEREKSR